MFRGDAMSASVRLDPTRVPARASVGACPSPLGRNGAHRTTRTSTVLAVPQPGNPLHREVWYPFGTEREYKFLATRSIAGKSNHDSRCGGWDSNPHVRADSA